MKYKNSTNSLPLSSPETNPSHPPTISNILLSLNNNHKLNPVSSNQYPNPKQRLIPKPNLSLRQLTKPVRRKRTKKRTQKMKARIARRTRRRRRTKTNKKTMKINKKPTKPQLNNPSHNPKPQFNNPSHNPKCNSPCHLLPNINNPKHPRHKTNQSRQIANSKINKQSIKANSSTFSKANSSTFSNQKASSFHKNSNFRNTKKKWKSRSLSTRN